METTLISHKSYATQEHSKEEYSSTSSFSKRKEKKRSFSEVLENASILVLQSALEKEKTEIEGCPLSSPLSGTSASVSYAAALVRSIDLAPEVLELFEKGVHAMTYLTQSGVSETTFFLDMHQFAGTKVTITEFNTAPKVFNISLVGSPEMAARFNAYAPDLLAAFHKSPFNFSVHRLESAVESHLVERKDLSDQQEDEEKQ